MSHLPEIADNVIRYGDIGELPALIEGAIESDQLGCLSPVKLCHYLLEKKGQVYGQETLFGRGYIKASA